jgi:hypothetical protein
MQKYTIEKVKKIPPKVLLKLINRAKKFLKKNQVVIDMFKDHNVDINDIDFIPIKFGDIDVSATTNHGVITLNYKLLCDGDFFKDYGYLTHEFQHILDQCYGEKPTMGADDGDYLSNPNEQAAFQKQIEYIDHMFGENKAEEYTNHLLDHHDKDGDEREDLKEKLMKEIE